MKKRKVVTGLIIVSMALSVSACAREHYPTEDEISEQMDEWVSGERYSQTDYEEDDKNNQLTVTFESDERDLVFHLYADKTKNSWQVNFLDDGDVTTNHHLSSDYIHNVHQLYLEDIEGILGDISAVRNTEWDYNTYRFETGFSDSDLIPQIVEVLVRANEVYSQELNYHDSEWVSQNRFGLVVLSYRSNATGEVTFISLEIDGISTAEDYYEQLVQGVDRVEE